MNNKTTVSELRILLYPKNYALTREFYINLIQWPIKHQWDSSDSKGTMFDTGSGIIELLWSQGEANPSSQGTVSLKVQDVWSLWKSLQDKATVVFPLRHNPWGDDSFCIADPAGFKLVFFTPSSPSHTAST